MKLVVTYLIFVKFLIKKLFVTFKKKKVNLFFTISH